VTTLLFFVFGIWSLWESFKEDGYCSAVAFQLTFVLCVLVFLLSTWLSDATLISEIRKNWMKLKQSWLANFIIIFCYFMDCILNYLLASSTQFTGCCL